MISMGDPDKSSYSAITCRQLPHGFAISVEEGSLEMVETAMD
jgi:hypothetical protein